MSDIIFQALKNSRLKKYQHLYQKYKYFLAIDFEATCDKSPIYEPKEIIEFPCLVLNAETLFKENQFHFYVKPTVKPILTDFCVDLTGITQETISESEEFPKVFERFNKWISENGYFTEPNKSTFVTHGDWDLKVMLPKQCAQSNILLPDYFNQWVDIRKSFYELKNYFPRGIKDICARLELEHKGSLHSGIDDVRNIISIIRELILQGLVIQPNSLNEIKKLIK